VGTKTGIDVIRANRSNHDWNESGDSQTLAYIDSSSSAQFAVMFITPSDRSLLSEAGDDPVLDGSGRIPSMQEQFVSPDRIASPQSFIESPEKS